MRGVIAGLAALMACWTQDVQAEALPAVPGPAPAEGVRQFGMTESPDGALRIFTLQDAAGIQLMEMRRLPEGGWSAPQPLAFSRPEFSDADPFFSPHDGALLFMSKRPHDGRQGERNDFDLWRVRPIKGGGWAAPEPLPAPINTPAQEIFPSQDRRGLLYFATNRERGAATHDVWRARQTCDGSWSIEALQDLNTPGWDGNPLISADGKTLILASDGFAGAGDSDLVIAERDDKTRWKAPRLLSDVVNTPEAEFAPGLSADGKTLFFTRGARLFETPLRDAVRDARKADRADPTG